MMFLLCTVLAADPSAEQLAFKLVNNTKVATACTTHERGPFGSVMPYAVDGEGRPLVLVSDLAVHTKNIKANPKASIFITESKDGDLDKARVTLIGNMGLVPEKELKSAKELYFKKFPKAKIYEQFHDFNIYRLEITDIYYVGGFGPKPIEWIDIERYRKSATQPAK